MAFARFFSNFYPFGGSPQSDTLGQKSYHKRATGAAAQTVKRHAKEHELKLYGSCFCPFVQRVWIALELKDAAYEYIEVDPYKKPPSLLDVNPRGLVPALRHGDWACHESTVLVEYVRPSRTYLATPPRRRSCRVTRRSLLTRTLGAPVQLEDAYPEAHPLLPRGPRARAHARLWADHVHRKIVPTFYSLLQAQDGATQAEHATALDAAIATLADAADPTGPFFAGADMGYVDVQLAPWLLRLRRVMTPYRGWPEPREGSRWERWVRAVEECEAVKRTTSGDELYLDSYERYARKCSPDDCWTPGRVSGEWGVLMVMQRIGRTRARSRTRSTTVGRCRNFDRVTP